jgi:hypothetical protein
MPSQPALKNASSIHIHLSLKAGSKQLLFQRTIKNAKPVDPALRSLLLAQELVVLFAMSLR